MPGSGPQVCTSGGGGGGRPAAGAGGGGLREPREAGGGRRGWEAAPERRAERPGAGAAAQGELQASGGSGGPPGGPGGPERPRLRGLGWGRVESQARCGRRQNRPRRDLGLGEAGDPGPAA